MVAFVLAVGATVWLLTVPVYRGGYGGGQMLIQVNGVERTLVVLAVPVVLTAIPLVWRKHKWMPAALLSGFTLIAMGIWPFYLPAAIALIYAAARDRCS